MKPKQAFGVVVRTVGLILLIIGALYVVSGLIALFEPRYKPAWPYFIIGTGGVLISLYLLRGGAHIVQFAYPETESDTKLGSN
jgi:hypothetical protein